MSAMPRSTRAPDAPLDPPAADAPPASPPAPAVYVVLVDLYIPDDHPRRAPAPPPLPGESAPPPPPLIWPAGSTLTDADLPAASIRALCDAGVLAPRDPAAPR